MAVWLPLLRIGIYCYVGHTGWGTASKACGRGSGCYLPVSFCRGLCQWRWLQPGNLGSENENSQTEHPSPFAGPLSPDGEEKKKGKTA